MANFLIDLLRASKPGRALAEVQQRDALRQLAMQASQGTPDSRGIIWNEPELNKQQALTRYAQITGDVSPILGVGSSGAPSAVQEYQFFDRLTPEEQRRYLGVKRAGQNLDVGGGFVRIDPVTNMPVPLVEKTLAPENLPQTRGAQAAATETGRLQAEEAFTSGKANEQTFSNLDAFTQLEEVSRAAPSGRLSNLITAGGELIGLGTEDAIAQGEFKAAVANAENLARAAFRVAGSGATSDRDAQPIIDLLPNINDSAEVKAAKIQKAKELLISKANATAAAKGKPPAFDQNGQPLFNANAVQTQKAPEGMSVEQKRARLEELRRKRDGQ